MKDDEDTSPTARNPPSPLTSSSTTLSMKRRRRDADEDGKDSEGKSTYQVKRIRTATVSTHSANDTPDRKDGATDSESSTTHPLVKVSPVTRVSDLMSPEDANPVHLIVEGTSVEGRVAASEESEKLSSSPISDAAATYQSATAGRDSEDIRQEDQLCDSGVDMGSGDDTEHSSRESSVVEDDARIPAWRYIGGW